MTRFSVARLAASALALCSASAFGASDVYLKFDGIKGESAQSGPQTLEVASWSWGESNPTSVGSGGMSSAKGKSNPSGWDLATSKGARAAAPGAATSPQVGDVTTLTVLYREAPTKASTGRAASACAKGQHINEAVLKADGRSYHLTDVVVLSCATGADGMRKHELRGHVTLIK